MSPSTGTSVSDDNPFPDLLPALQLNFPAHTVFQLGLADLFTLIQPFVLLHLHHPHTTMTTTLLHPLVPVYSVTRMSSGKK